MDRIRESSTFGTSRRASEVRSNRVAWTVAVVSVLLSSGHYVVERTRPPAVIIQSEVLRYNEISGAIDRPVKITDALEDSEFKDSVTRSQLRDVVTHWMSYNYGIVQSDYEWLGVRLSDKIAAVYLDSVTEREQSYIDKVDVTVKIIGSWLDNDRTGSVRFSTTAQKEGVRDPIIEYWQATMTFEYRDTTKMKPEDRNKNEIGFLVTNWRLTPESAS